MSSPLEYIDNINFNTYKYPQYTHLIETCPNENEKEKVIRICRCWQSKKFPYCDDTHKLLVENGDSVGPYVAKLVSHKLTEEQKMRRHQYTEKYMKLNNYNKGNKRNILLTNSDKTYIRRQNFQRISYFNRLVKGSVFVTLFTITSSVCLFLKKKEDFFCKTNDCTL